MVSTGGNIGSGVGGVGASSVGSGSGGSSDVIEGGGTTGKGSLVGSGNGGSWPKSGVGGGGGGGRSMLGGANGGRVDGVGIVFIIGAGDGVKKGSTEAGSLLSGATVALSGELVALSA